jgi:hypothetical protein
VPQVRTALGSLVGGRFFADVCEIGGTQEIRSGLRRGTSTSFIVFIVFALTCRLLIDIFNKVERFK